MLKVLMLRRSIDAKRAELAELERKDADFQTREAELETAINEVEPGNAEQEAAVNAEIEAYEADKAAHDEAKQKLSADIEGLEAELDEIERNAPKPPTPESHKTTDNVRGDMHMETINIRALPKTRRAFDALAAEQRNAIVAQDDVKNFLGTDHPCRVPGPDLREHVPVFQASEPRPRPLCGRPGPTDHRGHRARGRLD